MAFEVSSRNQRYLGKTISDAFLNRLKKNDCSSGIQCGSSSPGFMIGNNPKAEGKTRKKKVCFSQGGKCCARKVSIRVKRCPGGFLVYQLPAAPSGNARYCSQASTFVCLKSRFIQTKIIFLKGNYRFSALNNNKKARYV